MKRSKAIVLLVVSVSCLPTVSLAGPPQPDGQILVADPSRREPEVPLGGTRTPGQCAPSEIIKVNPTGIGGDYFGAAVAISGDTAVVGAREDSTNWTDGGAAYVYIRSGANWVFQAKLFASDASNFGYFGASVAISGNTIVVGALDDNAGGNDAGSAYVFVRSQEVWAQQAKLTASDAAAGDLFGGAVAISGDTALIGALGDTHAGGTGAGSAYVFTRSGAAWTQEQKLVAMGAADFDYFGGTVAIEGNTAVIGAHLDDHAAIADAGSAYVFTRAAGYWSQEDRLFASDAAQGDRFGARVGMSGSTIVVGSYLDDHSGWTDAGSSYVFAHTGGSWTQQAKLTASAVASEEFGFSVGIYGDTIVVGVPYHSLQGANYAGAAYLYTRGGTTWTEQAKLIASDAAALKLFGTAVAVFADSAIVGSEFNSNGSAYLFNLGCAGACCVPGQGCQQLVGTDCDSTGGVFYGIASSCTPNPCPGACCATNGTCSIATAAACAAGGGTYQGDGTTCTPNPCPQPTGACCFSNGTCSILTATACTTGGGTYQGDGTTCTPNPCPQPTGACCDADGSCSITTAAACTAGGGTYQGDSTSCNPNPCPQPTGACCVTNGTCSITTLAACTTGGGTYQGDGTSCAPNPCPQPTGACCASNGTCSIATAAGCSAGGGTYQGDGTTCTPNPCPPPQSILIDGTADVAYGSPVVVQNTQTGFGDNTLQQVDFANGSELDNCYALIADGNLYLLVAGNLESNYNKLEVFLDTTSGGQNRLRGDNWPGDSGGLNRMGDDGSGNGLRFDSFFDADYWIGVTGGGAPYALYANFAAIATTGGGPGWYCGQTTAVSDGVLSGGQGGAPAIRATINNSNTAGVTAGTGAGTGAGVTTGVELAIPLSAIGNPASIKVCIFINGILHDYVSNQVLAGIGGGANLAEPRTVNFATIANRQYFVVGPEPTGACCAANGTCLVLTAVACSTGGGTFQGSGSTCNPDPCQPIRINEIRIDQPSGASGDTEEYSELTGSAGASLSGYWYIVIGDGPRPRGAGVIEEVINLSTQTIPADGHLLVGEKPSSAVFAWTLDMIIPLNFENNDNVTHLLVRDFTGVRGQDLDTDDNGTLDVQPWSQIVDCVAVLQDTQIGDRVYCGNTVGPFAGANRNFAPGHVYRLPDETGAWQIGPFDPRVGDDTPGAVNAIATGACCVGSSCTPSQTKSQCTATGGTWMGPGTACSPNNVCVGACCAPDGTCSLQTEVNCRSLGRWFRGGGTVCAGVDCICDGEVKINEVWASDPVNDTVEYIEFYMPPCASAARGTTFSLAGMSLIVVDGDTSGGGSDSDYKRVSYRQDFSAGDTISASGFVVLGSVCAGIYGRDMKLAQASQRGCTPPSYTFSVGTLENHSQTYALVRTQDLAFCSNPSNPTVPPAGCQNEVDSHRLTDASVAAITTNQIDTVATIDVDPGDLSYFGAPVVQDGIFQATQMQRTADGQDTDMISDWEVQWNLEADDPVSTSSPGLPNIQGLGACCVSATCTPNVTQAQCATMGGIYRGNGTACTPNPCAGACCIGGACTANQTPSDCAAAGGAYMGDGITCAEPDCAGVTVANARNSVGTGHPVILNDAVVISTQDMLGASNMRAFEVASGGRALTVVGLNAEIDAILAGVSAQDTIDLAGTTDQWNGLFQLTGDIAPLKRIQYQDTSADPGIVTLTASDLQNGSATAEANESKIAILECMVFVDGGAGVFQGDRSYLATDGAAFASIFVPATAQTLIGQPIPTGSKRLQGIFWQSDFSLPTDTPPENTGYRLALRTASDILSPICAAPEGACCVPEGGCVCSQTTQALCLAAGGAWIGGTCSPSTLCQNHPSRMQGDVEGDGDIDLADVGYFALAVIGYPYLPAHVIRSDLNCDGAANGRDIAAMTDVIIP